MKKKLIKARLTAYWLEQDGSKAEDVYAAYEVVRMLKKMVK